MRQGNCLAPWPSATSATPSSTAVHTCWRALAWGHGDTKAGGRIKRGLHPRSDGVYGRMKLLKVRQPGLPEAAVLARQLQAVRAVAHRAPAGPAVPRRRPAGGASASAAAALHQRLEEGGDACCPDTAIRAEAKRDFFAAFGVSEEEASALGRAAAARARQRRGRHPVPACDESLSD